MELPTEPIGSIPRPRALTGAYVAHMRGLLSKAARDALEQVGERVLEAAVEGTALARRRLNG